MSYSSVRYVVACSGGNDSVALIQFMLNNYDPSLLLVLYNNTGWARDDWVDRINDVKERCANKAVLFRETSSQGFSAMVIEKKGFPMPASKMQFCTQVLKTGPTLAFLTEYDPDGDWIIVTGRRREESNNRRNLPKREPETSIYKGRDVYNPLVEYTVSQRDVLITAFGLPILNHASMECFPCVCSNKSDIKMLSEYPSRIEHLKNLELQMGHTRNGKPRVMFRAYSHGGAIGIENIILWGTGERGQKFNSVPPEYCIPKVDYSGYRGNLNSSERVTFWADIKRQCVDLGYDLTDLPTDIAYDDMTKEGREFARQCDGGLCTS